MQIGAQLYTVRKHFTNLEDFDKGLKTTADIGYKAVQVSGTCAYDAYWLRDELQKYDLTCAITHIPPQRLMEELEKVVADHNVFGCKNIGIGSIPAPWFGSYEGYFEFRKVFIPIAEKIRDMGSKLMFHNHAMEFEDHDGDCIFNRLLEDFPADALDFTLDCGWADFAGQDVPKLIESLKGRLSRIHLKDYADLPADGSIEKAPYMRPIYEGKMDYDAIINALKNAGTEYALVEQDNCYDEEPFECLRRSYNNVVARFPEMK